MKRIALLVALTVARTASANPSAAEPRAQEPESKGASRLPVECRRFAWVPSDAKNDVMAWNQVLSLVACIQDDAVGSATDAAQLAPMVELLSKRLAVAMLTDVEVMEHGPARVQLRAAYQVGLAHIAFVTRARRSIRAPDDLLTNPRAQRRFLELHDQLEPLLVNARKVALVAFLAIDRAVAEKPELANDPVTAKIAHDAHAMLEQMRDLAPPEVTSAGPEPELAAIGGPAPATARSRQADRAASVGSSW